MKLLQDALREVASGILEILSDDPFPASVYPECLCSAVRSYPIRGGKRIRPALVLWSCGALGGDLRLAVNAAAAVEVYHSWTLVHDDIIDEDDVRRGQPSTHAELKTHAAAAYKKTPELCAKFGRDFAILAGDLAQSRAFHMLRRSRENISEAAMRRISAMMLKLGAVGVSSGEALDVLAGYCHEADQETLDHIVARKTSDLIEFAAAAGAVAGGADTVMTENFAVFARNMGMAFQLRDDVLGVYGEVSRFGKPIGSDEKNQKTTYVTLYGIEEAEKEVKRLSEEAELLLEDLPGDHSAIAELIRMMIGRRS